MSALLHKPLDYGSLPQRLREAIGAARGSAGDGVEVSTVVRGDRSLDIDHDYLATFVAEHGLERSRACVKAFLAETRLHVVKLRSHLAELQWQDLGDLAHNMAGLSATLGAVTLADGLLQLEDASRTETVDVAGAVLCEVEETWRRLQVTMELEFEALYAQRADKTNRAA